MRAVHLHPPGGIDALTVDGNYTQNATGTLKAEIVTASYQYGASESRSTPSAARRTLHWPDGFRSPPHKNARAARSSTSAVFRIGAF